MMSLILLSVVSESLELPHKFLIFSHPFTTIFISPLWLFMQRSSFYISHSSEMHYNCNSRHKRCLRNTSGNNVRVSLSRTKKEERVDPPDMHDRSRVRVCARKNSSTHSRPRPLFPPPFEEYLINRDREREREDRKTLLC